MSENVDGLLNNSSGDSDHVCIVLAMRTVNECRRSHVGGSLHHR